MPNPGMGKSPVGIELLAPAQRGERRKVSPCAERLIPDGDDEMISHVIEKKSAKVLCTSMIINWLVMRKMNFGRSPHGFQHSSRHQS
jgi:hypothetical protein